MNIPAVNPHTIGDLVPEVVDALQQRTDLTVPFVSKYLKRAIVEITQNNPFEQLRVAGPVQSGMFQTNVYSYPVSSFLPTGTDYTTLESFSVFLDTPTDNIAYPLDYATPKAITPLLHIPSAIPAKWTRFGTQILIGPQPSQNLDGFVFYQKRHPFNEANLSVSPLYIPDTWEDIVVYAAAERISIVKRWTDQRQMFHDLLFGDPDFQRSGGKQGRPGLIQARRFQMERDQDFNTRQMQMRVSRYNPM